MMKNSTLIILISLLFSWGMHAQSNVKFSDPRSTYKPTIFLNTGGRTNSRASVQSNVMHVDFGRNNETRAPKIREVLNSNTVVQNGPLNVDFGSIQNIRSSQNTLRVVNVSSNHRSNWQRERRNTSFGTNSSVRFQEGYFRSNGTYVNGHMKTRRNDTNWDNFSTKGNRNPFTGSKGTRARDYSREAYNYGSGRTIYTGPRGGQYYINSNGNKVYVQKR